jgi:hypothetical protein
MNERQKAVTAMKQMIWGFEKHFNGRLMPVNSQKLLEMMEARLLKSMDETQPVQSVEIRDFYSAL